MAAQIHDGADDNDGYIIVVDVEAETLEYLYHAIGASFPGLAQLALEREVRAVRRTDDHDPLFAGQIAGLITTQASLSSIGIALSGSNDEILEAVSAFNQGYLRGMRDAYAADPSIPDEMLEMIDSLIDGGASETVSMDGQSELFDAMGTGDIDGMEDALAHELDDEENPIAGEHAPDSETADDDDDGERDDNEIDGYADGVRVHSEQLDPDPETAEAVRDPELDPEDVDPESGEEQSDADDESESESGDSEDQ